VCVPQSTCLIMYILVALAVRHCPAGRRTGPPAQYICLVVDGSPRWSAPGPRYLQGDWTLLPPCSYLLVRIGLTRVTARGCEHLHKFLVALGAPPLVPDASQPGRCLRADRLSSPAARPQLWSPWRCMCVGDVCSHLPRHHLPQRLYQRLAVTVHLLRVALPFHHAAVSLMLHLRRIGGVSLP
jgi:hypothetical protein